MTIQFTDNALSHLGADITSTDTVITLEPGAGAKFPAVSGTDANFFVVTLEDSSGNREFVRVDHRSGDTLGSTTYPCTRGYWGSTARGFTTADAVVDIRWSTNAITELFGSYVQKSGDTMTGFLTLSGTPTSNLHAATKKYVDDADNLRVLKAGDTMTGALALPSDPANPLEAATKQYVDQRVLKSGDTMTGLLTLSGDPTSALHAATKQYVDARIAQGQCRLEYTSATQLTLKPHNGDKLIVNDGSQWVVRTIPSAGITLGAPAAANTTYYIYAYDNAGSLALEAITTGHATDSGTGFEVKSGDATRLLVGMARSNASIQWEDGNGVIGVLSWFNRKPRYASAYNTALYRSNYNAYSAVSGGICYLLCWESFRWRGYITGNATDSGGSAPPNGFAFIGARVAVDGTGLNTRQTQQYTHAGAIWLESEADGYTETTEGWHYAQLEGAYGDGASLYTTVAAGQARIEVETLG